MKKISMKKIIIVAVITLIVFVLYTLQSAGSFKTIISHSELKDLTMYTNMAGTEDLDIDPSLGLLFISSSDRWNTNGDANQKDGIYVLNTQVDNAQPVKLKTTLKQAFHPHGIHFLKKGEKKYLFAVNHNSLGDFVEVFEFDNNSNKSQLIHLKSYKNETMCCPNDVVAVDVDKFYVTNDHGAAEGIGRTLEEYLQLANSYLLYFDGAQFKKVLEGVRYANGVNISNDGQTLYVTEASGGKIFVMNRNIETGELTHRFSKELNTGADNINIDSNGSLWVGAHPKLLAFVGHATNTGKLSPSQILKLTHKGVSDFNVEEVYLDTGEQISGSSAALHYKNQVYVGVVFESKLLKGTY
jgi:arylesterase/paraoxonase